MRSLWQGAISFGLVNIPIKMYAATENRSVHFNQLHGGCNAPIRYHKVCSSCGKEAAAKDILKGYEYDKGRYVVIEPDELEALAPERSRAIEILDFVELSEIDPIYFDKSYYLEPSESAKKAFALLHRVMQHKQRVAIAKVVIRSSEALCALRVYNDVIAMSTLHYPDEVRAVAELHGADAAVAPSERELSLAEALVEDLTRPFDPSAYQDGYRESVLALIERKVAGDEVKVAPTPAASDKVIDLMTALEESLKAREQNKPDEAEQHALAH